MNARSTVNSTGRQIAFTRPWAAATTWLTGPIATFTSIALILVTLGMSAIAWGATSYYRSAIIEREGTLLREFVQSRAGEDIADLLLLPDEDARAEIGQRMMEILALSEVVRINVFDQNREVVWSSRTDLAGQSHADDPILGRSIDGEVIHVADPFARSTHAQSPIDRAETVEFYVPLASGAAGVYRNARSLERTLARGNAIIWFSAGGGGLLLYGALLMLFMRVRSQKEEAEQAFARLSDEHRHLIQLEKLSGMGRLVGEIAHQLNSPLVGVINAAELAERHADDPERVRRLLSTIKASGHHCRDFVGRVLDLGRQAGSELIALDLRMPIAEMVDLFHQTRTNRVSVETSLPAQAALVEGDAVLLRHLIFNLLGNAAQAAPGGVIEVVLEQNDSHWLLGVHDRGPGLPAELGERVFEAFVTTRREGTGLGLTIARYVAVAHHGQLRARNREGGGASFELVLPTLPEEDG